MKTRIMVKGILLVAVLFWLTVPWVGYSAVPGTINYQGYLTDSAGTPINTTVQIAFSLYTTATGVSALWTETQNVAVVSGVYSVNLGSVNPINPATVPFDTQYYLGVKVGADPEMTPRQALSSVGYAFRSLTTDTVTGSGSFTSPIVSTVTTGTAPLQVTSTTVVPNLNVDMIDGKHESDFVSVGQANSITAGMIFLPLDLIGSRAEFGLLRTTNTDALGVGVEGTAPNFGGIFTGTGLGGTGVRGNAYATGATSNTGGYFTASGNTGRGVFGSADATGDTMNYGGFFTASGDQGKGIFARASATGAANNFGGHFEARGNGGTGVFGRAFATGSVTNYGGYFLAGGDTGYGVYADALAYGGYFRASGNSGRGVYGYASNTSGNNVGVYGQSDSPTGWAGYFQGRALVTGALTASSFSGDGSGLTNVTGNPHTHQGADITSGSIDTARLSVPVQLSGTVAYNGIVGGENSSNWGIGIYGSASESNGKGVVGTAYKTVGENYGGFFSASGDLGRGVYGRASAFGPANNYGGYFETAGDSGRGVFGLASAQGAVTNFGGYFVASGDLGYGIYGSSSGTTGTGVWGAATNTGAGANFGGYFTAAGNSGRSVYGTASAVGAVTNYGGYFVASGDSGRGVYGEANATGAWENYGGYFLASGSSGKGVLGSATGSSGTGVYGEATATGAVENFGGYFLAFGNSGKGVLGSATGSSGTGVYGEATDIGAVINYGGRFEANGNSGRGVYGQASATGAVTNYGGYFVASGDSGRGVYGGATGSSGRGVMGNGGLYDFYALGTGTNYGPFTGAHEVKLSNDFPADLKSGFIVSVTGKVKKRLKDDGSVSISSTLPTVRLSDKPNDKAVFGALVREAGLPEDHWHGATEGERFGVVNALGEGRVWVTNINGNIEAGDYITTSAVSGYGQRQDDDLLRSYTLGKAIETVDWDMVAETVQYNGKTYKIYLIAVVYTSG